MDRHEPKLAGNSKDLPMGVNIFNFTLFIADFLQELSSPAGARVTKELSRWDTTWESLLVNVEQRQQRAEVSGGAERRFF